MSILKINNQTKLKPFFVYAARCLFDIEQALGDRRKVFYTELKSGVFLVWYR